ncbi:MAG: DEAD/DEAH box helicase [Desulfatibacillaceae bacterium]
MDFSDFKLHEAVAAGVKATGFDTPTPIQVQGIPEVMAGRDIMGLAQTGTGKTAAFVLPILHRLMSGPRNKVRALVLAPTRELAEQIRRDVVTLGKKTGLKSVSVYGGVGIAPQAAALRRSQIVVACPGRLLDHMNRGNVDFSKLDVLVLDEADMMLDMGFLPDIRRILAKLPVNRQNLLFSATMPAEIRNLSKELLRDPKTVQVGNPAPAQTVSHAMYPVAQHQKTDLLLEILRATETRSVLVFTRTKHRAKRLGEKLARAGYRSTSLQGNLSQGKRQAALDGFRSGAYKVMVATDIAARGIDVTRVSHVINFDVPDTSDAYIHRIGRTGRASCEGCAYTLVTNEDKAMVSAISRLLGGPVESRRVDGFNYGTQAPAKNPGSGPGKRPTFRPKQVGNGRSGGTRRPARQAR